MNKKILFAYVFSAFAIIGLDRITKSWALGLLHELVVNQFLSFGLTFNRGINWGIFNSTNSIAFIFINIAIAAVIIGMLLYTIACWRHRLSIWGHVFILAGALSNYYDRIMHGGVIDFIVLSAGDWSWPAFNIADAAILFGVGLLAYQHAKNR